MLKQRLDQRQVQKLVLAPALQQAIKLLPLTNLELIEVIDEELSENPMIEIVEDDSDKDVRETAAEPGTGETAEAEKASEELPSPEPPEDRIGERAEETAPEDPERELAIQEAAPGSPEEAEKMDAEAGFQDYLDDGFRPNFGEKIEAVSLENTLSRSPSLWDHLNWQASLTFFGREEREIAQFIIGNIDDDGYLSSPVEEIAGLCRAETGKVEAIRQKIRTFDPLGVGSLDLREALLAQLDYLEIGDGIAREIVDRHLHLLEKSDFVQLARVLNIPLQEVREHIDLIKGLDPAPGRKYNEEKTTYVVPDIIVTKEGDEWKIVLNDEGLPRLRISGYYKQLLAKAARSQPEACRFLKDRLKKALWFLRSLEQRNQTIHRVARFIVDKQKDFFDKGLDFIKPLTLMEIAQEIGVHESTVGRVVANKHMMTPRGVFSLKYFFHKSLQGDYGEEVSSLKIKDKIRKLVEQEDRNNPLSDIEIGDILARENLKIARRTVAKYRAQLKILPSHIRKRKFSMEGST
jgi:RNA polymerase sigma-54 factor